MPFSESVNVTTARCTTLLGGGGPFLCVQNGFIEQTRVSLLNNVSFTQPNIVGPAVLEVAFHRQPVRTAELGHLSGSEDLHPIRGMYTNPLALDAFGTERLGCGARVIFTTVEFLSERSLS